MMDRLERDAGHRLQILRINLKEPIGTKNADRYQVTLTPPFQLFNGSGTCEAEFTLVLGRVRILYWLGQQNLTPWQ